MSDNPHLRRSGHPLDSLGVRDAAKTKDDGERGKNSMFHLNSGVGIGLGRLSGPIISPELMWNDHRRRQETITLVLRP